MANGLNTRSPLHSEAAAHLAANRLRQAETAYRRLLTDNPDDDAALHGLGTIALAAQQPAVALKLLERAARLRPESPDHQDKLGVALALTGRVAEAGEAFRRAVQLQPDNLGAHFNLGLWLLNAGSDADALAEFSRLTKAIPNHATAWLNKGIAHARMRQFLDARDSLSRALALAPADTNARLNFANVLKEMGALEDAESEYRRLLEGEPGNLLALFNLGVTLNDMRRRDEALTTYHRVLALDPDHLDTMNNIGAILLEQGKPEEAMTYFERVLRERPNDSQAICNKATALHELDRPREALALLNALTEHAPSDIAAASARAHTLMQIGDLARADEAFAEILARAPNESKCLYGRALCRLRMRDFALGFELYEHRWDSLGETKRTFSLPDWNGVDQPGPVLVWHEQGIGDQILFAGLLPFLAQHDVSFAYECDKRLLPLLRRSFPEFVFIEPPSATAILALDYAAQIPAGSLPHRLKLWPANAAASLRYLESDPERRGELDARLAALGRAPRIGISWRSTRRIVGTTKSLPLAMWEPILKNRDAVFVNLQYGETEDEIAAAQASSGALIYTEPTIDRFSDIDGLTALIDSLDLIITTSNITAHIAGALGKPCWLALQRTPLWYWAMDGDVPYIYASIRTFRQREVGDWAPVVAGLAHALTAWLASDG